MGGSFESMADKCIDTDQNGATLVMVPDSIQLESSYRGIY